MCPLRPETTRGFLVCTLTKDFTGYPVGDMPLYVFPFRISISRRCSLPCFQRRVAPHARLRMRLKARLVHSLQIRWVPV